MHVTSATSTPRIYVHGAILPHCLAGGVARADLRWRVGNLVVRDEALEFRGPHESFSVPIPSVTSVTGGMVSLPPPPLDFEESFLIHHTDARSGAPVSTAIAYPRVIVGNLPLQLAAALTGTIRASLLTLGADGAYTTEAGYFSMSTSGFVITPARARPKLIPLDAVSGVTMRRVRIPDGREAIEWTIDHVEGASLARVGLVSVERLPFLVALLHGVQGLRHNVRRESTSSIHAVTEQAQQVATLLYTMGASAAAVEQMLALSPDDVDAVFDDLLKRGLAEVVKVRKEVRLTAAGAKLVDEIMKKQMQLPAGGAPA